MKTLPFKHFFFKVRKKTSQFETKMEEEKHQQEVPKKEGKEKEKIAGQREAQRLMLFSHSRDDYEEMCRKSNVVPIQPWECKVVVCLDELWFHLDLSRHQDVILEWKDYCFSLEKKQCILSRNPITVGISYKWKKSYTSYVIERVFLFPGEYIKIKTPYLLQIEKLPWPLPTLLPFDEVCVKLKKEFEF